jgi:MerR family transcriptional regulator/heat shock protein HspR
MQRLEIILTLTRELGVNLAGVEVILHMREKLENLQLQVEEMMEFVRDQISPALTGSMRNALVRIPTDKIVRTQR